MVVIPKHIQKLTPYRPGMPIEDLAKERNLSRIVKLASNENPNGPSPKALEAINKALPMSHLYPNPVAPVLVDSLSKKLSLKPEQIVCGNGIDSLLASIITAFSSVNDEILTADATFIGIYVHAAKFGRKLTLVPLKNWTFDLDAIAKAVTDKTKIIYIANPNNPTGTMFLRHDFDNFMKKVPDNVLVVLDEAYEHYASLHPEYVNGLEFLNNNLISLRTFSKVYGLAGLRVGYAIGVERLISELYKVKLPFEPGTPAQFAAAAALSDDKYVADSVELNKNILEKMKTFFNSVKLQYLESWANFLMIKAPSTEYAVAFQNECLEHGLILRHVAPFGAPNGIRITTGNEDGTHFAFNVITKVLSKFNSN